MPAQGCDPRGLQAGRPAADHRHRNGFPCPTGYRGVGRLMAGRRFTHAGHQRVAVVPYLADLVAQNAWTRGPAGPCGCHQVRVGDLRPGHLHRVGHTGGQCRLGHVDVHHAALQDDRDGAAAARIRRAVAAVRVAGVGQRRSDRAGELAVEAGFDMHVRPGRRYREDRPTDHHQVVVGPGERTDDLNGCLGGHSRPRRQLVTGQPQPDDRVPGRLPRGGQHLSREAQAVRAVLVLPGVRQTRQELPYQAVLTGVHLHAVAAGGERRAGRSSEASYHRVDVSGLHRLRHFAGVYFRYSRRCPQLPLGVRRTALTAGVPQRGDEQGAVRVHRVRDRPPALAAVGGEGGPFVRPV